MPKRGYNNIGNREREQFAVAGVADRKRPDEVELLLDREGPYDPVLLCMGAYKMRRR